MYLLPTSKGSPPSVGDLQQVLIEGGFSIASAELQAETFGDSTRSAVLAFQAQAGLVVDGVPGPKTWGALRNGGASRYTAPEWRYDLADVQPALVEVVRFVVGEIGQCEHPPASNRGPRIDLYQAPHRGRPYCAYFVSYAYRLSTPPSPFGKKGAVWDIYEWAEKNGRVLGESERPEPGDLAVVLRGGRRGHVAMVVHVLPDGRLCTVGANEGNAVRGRVRRREDFTAIIRPLPRPA